MRIQLEGLENLQARLEQMENELSGNIREEATMKGAERLQKAISESAPKGTDSSQRMADNIIIKKEDQGVAIGPAAPFYYAFFVEFGTSRMSPTGSCLGRLRIIEFLSFRIWAIL